MAPNSEQTKSENVRSSSSRTTTTRRKKQSVRKKTSDASLNADAQCVSVEVEKTIKRVWWSKTPLELYHFDQIPKYLQDSMI